MDEKYQKLYELGAGDFEHVDGSLIAHLKGTQNLLESWSASTALADAGLYHAAYGTAAVDETMVSTQQRSNIVEIIGAAAEELVYQYCACNRKDFFPRIGVEINPRYNNRFTGEHYYLDKESLKNFCELTAANEIEIASNNELFVEQHGQGLYLLFSNMAPYLSRVAQRKVDETYSPDYV